MKFEGIDIYGFKSFADKSSISFQEGITAIVGPNGCGKSNVVDAIRWVLGEQSAKLLRGKTMQDVIFDGTEKRKSLSYCEVALKFNNALPDRIFKTLDFDNVIISRKLFRNGTSSYLINGVESKLKDIKAIIRETGLGREGYSIVGQGSIDDIVKTKPENRRAIFEDAAGVLGNKMAKKEAEANLESYETNKRQYELLLTELERNLSTLEKQSETARKWLEIRDELMSLEANTYIFQKENNGIQKERIKSKIAGLAEKIASLQKELAEQNNKFNSITEDQQELDNKLSKLRDEKTDLAVKQAEITGTGNTINASKDGLLRTKKDYSERLAELEQSFDDRNGKLRDLYAKRSMAEEEVDGFQKELTIASNRQSQLVSEILDHEKQIENQNAEINKMLESAGDIKANLGKIQAEQQSILDRIAEFVQSLEDLQQKIDDNEYIRNEQEKVTEKYKLERDKLEKTVEDLTSSYSRLEKELEDLRDRGNDLQYSVSGYKSKIALLEEYVKNYEGLGNTSKLLKAAESDSSVKSRILGVVANVAEVPTQYQVAIETALGNSMQNVIVDDEDSGKYLIQYLKNHQLGRITFLPISSFRTRELDPSKMGILRERGCLGIASKLIKYSPKFNSIFSGLLGSTIICDNIDNAVIIARKYSYSVKIVTLQGEVLNTSGSMTGGFQRASTGVLSQETALKKAKEDLLIDQKQLEEAIALFKEKKSEYDDLAEQIEEYESEAKIAGEKYARENAKYEAIIEVLTDLNNRYSQTKQDKEKAENRCQLIREALAKVDKQNQTLSGSKNDISGDAVRKRNEFNKMKEEKTELDDSISELKIKLSTIKVDLSNINEDIDRIESEKKTLIQSIDNCKQILSSNDTEIKVYEAKLNKAILSPAEKQRLKDIEAVIKQCEAQREEKRNELKLVSDKKDALSNEILSLSETKTRQESMLINIDDRMKALETKIFEDYEMDYEKALTFRDPEFKYEEAQSKIKSLKASKAALGSVNIESIEQYKEEKVRYDEMHAQYDDVVKAEEDCRQIIAQLSAEILAKFNVEFDKINKNFQETFKELFAGGSGRLVVKDVEPGQDPLEAGVDIYVQPPGKSVQLMTLLSGGEQALTAMAILFAILRLRPMPFCVLDEIEAALDEGNVGVYAKFLKKFAQDTQFIVITHRKPTMEKADRLYGVTMQERGVSKVVQVNLAEAVVASK